MIEQAARFDLADPMYLADPYPTWARMRVEAPVYWDDNVWHITRYDQCVAALKDRRLSSDRTEVRLRALAPEVRSRVVYYETMRRAMMLFVDPPDHTRLRRLVARAFTPRAAEALRPRIQQITNELLAAAPPDFDAMRDLALPLPYYVIADLIGIPREDRAQVKQWSSDVAVSVLRTTPEVTLQADASMRAFSAYLRPIVHQLRASPAPNLFSLLVEAEEAGERLSEDELFATAILLIVAGHETTTALIGNGLWLLLSHPDQRQLLRDTPALLRNLSDEVLRYHSVVQALIRVPTEDVEIGGTPISRGEPVAVVLGAANRDPAVFRDPDRFDVTRSPNPHLGFGDFIHRCLGAPLALVEGEVAFGTLLRRYPELRFADAPVAWDPAPAQPGRGIVALPLHLGSPAGLNFG